MPLRSSSYSTNSSKSRSVSPSIFSSPVASTSLSPPLFCSYIHHIPCLRFCISIINMTSPPKGFDLDGTTSVLRERLPEDPEKEGTSKKPVCFQNQLPKVK